ncbi:MAG: hypothetical protein ACYDDQ_11030 [Vulcanimicrobiaceae bacterium]
MTGSLRKLQDGKGITVRAARDHVWFQRRIPKVPRQCQRFGSAAGTDAQQRDLAPGRVEHQRSAVLCLGHGFARQARLADAGGTDEQRRTAACVECVVEEIPQTCDLAARPTNRGDSLRNHRTGGSEQMEFTVVAGRSSRKQRSCA